MAVISHDSETSAHGQQVHTAVAFIHRKMDGVHQLFLAKRASTKRFLPDVYELPGGHIDYGEDIVDGLRREVMEEFAVNVKVGDPFYVYSYENIVKGSHSIEVAYFAQFIDPEENIKINPEDHSEYGWFTREQVQDMVAESRRGVTLLESIKITDDIDHEVLVMLKGFDLLEGKELDFGVA